MFHLTYTMLHGSTKLKFWVSMLALCLRCFRCILLCKLIFFTCSGTRTIFKKYSPGIGSAYKLCALVSVQWDSPSLARRQSSCRYHGYMRRFPNVRVFSPRLISRLLFARSVSLCRHSRYMILPKTLWFRRDVVWWRFVALINRDKFSKLRIVLLN